MTAHKIVNPPELSPAIGFAHAVVAEPGRTIYLGGQTAHDRGGDIVGDTLLAQMDVALANVVIALGSAGARPTDLVQMQLFVRDADAYRAARREMGPLWQRHLGHHYPAMALFEVKDFADPRILIEIMAIAVAPLHEGD